MTTATKDDLSDQASEQIEKTSCLRAAAGIFLVVAALGAIACYFATKFSPRSTATLRSGVATDPAPVDALTSESLHEFIHAHGDRFQGDVVIDNEYDMALNDYNYADEWNETILGPRESSRRILGAVGLGVNLWKDNTVKYKFSSYLPGFTKKLVRNAMREIELNTCVRFQEKPDAILRYLSIEPSAEKCEANIGAPAHGIHIIRLSESNAQRTIGCIYPTVVHELLHALGFSHTQTRSDRDKFVTIIWSRIPWYNRKDFSKQTTSWFPKDPKAKEYDYKSVMHYSRNQFSVNGRNTIDAGKNTDVIGTGYRMSERDIMQINELYGCPARDTLKGYGKNEKYRGLSYPRRAGSIPKGCSKDENFSGGLCYAKCRDGYASVGPVCWQKCGGFGRDDGAFCAKPKPYGRGGGRSINCGWRGCGRSCPSSKDQWGLRCYPKCRQGYVNHGCCICSPRCPSGMKDIGVSCAKKSYGRVGIPRKCKTGYVYDAGLCYKPCDPFYKGIGPVCWWAPKEGKWAHYSNQYGEYA